jgi:hypothetical protein
VGSTATEDFQPFQLGAAPQNWIGRSQYPGDPYLNGQVKDFRIYHGALSADDIYALATAPPGGAAAPAAPSNLVATALPAVREIDLSWTNNAPDAGMVLIERSTDGVNFVQIAVLAGTATTYADTDPALQPSTHYWYRLRARNSTGFSDYSNLFDVFSSRF